MILVNGVLQIPGRLDPTLGRALARQGFPVPWRADRTKPYATLNSDVRESIIWHAPARMIGEHFWAGAWSEDWIGCTAASLLARRRM